VVDDFEIAFPFMNDRIHGQQQGTRNDLERSGHFNHMMDAALNLERYMQNMVGGSVQGRSSRAWTNADDGGGYVLAGANLLMAYASYTQPLTGDLNTTPIRVRFTVPDLFGATPFADFRFSVSPNLYLSFPGYTTVQGVAATDQPERYMDTLLKYPQLFASIQPVSGSPRAFDVVLTNAQVGRYGLALDGKFSEGCSRPSIQYNLNPGWVQDVAYVTSSTVASSWMNQPYTGTPFGFGESNWPNPPVDYLWISSAGHYGDQASTNYGPNSGRAYPQPLVASASHQMIFEYYSIYDNGGLYFYVGRFGPCLRMSGPMTSASGYMMLLGDQWMLTDDWNTVREGRLIKFHGVDMTVAGTSLRSFKQDFPSNVTVLASFDAPCTQWSGQNCMYSFGCTGTTINIRRSLDGGAWTTVASVTDATGPSNGYMGFTAFPHNKLELMGFFNNHTNASFAMFKNISCQVLSGETTAQAQIQLLYSMVGDTSHLAFE
jgi:hypothetical protein